MEGKIHSVKGDISPGELGTTLMHEHFLFGYPGWQGDATLGGFDRAAALNACVAMAREAKGFGVKTIVDATPNECGRDPEFLQEVSERADINIVCSSGYYFEGEGAPAYFKFRSTLTDIHTEVYDMFKKEVSCGIADTGIRPGVFKLASGQEKISDYEMVFFRAAAAVSKEEHVPVITHTEHGCLGPAQAELLIHEGVAPERIMIGHVGGSTDMDYLLTVLSHGVYIGFDRFGIQGIAGTPFDDRRMGCMIGLIGLGFADRIMLSQDFIMHWLGRPLVLPEAAAPLLGNWSTTHIFKNIVPALEKAGITEDQVQTMLVENPKKFFGG